MNEPENTNAVAHDRITIAIAPIGIETPVGKPITEHMSTLEDILMISAPNNTHIVFMTQLTFMSYNKELLMGKILQQYVDSELLIIDVHIYGYAGINTLDTIQMDPSLITIYGEFCDDIKKIEEAVGGKIKFVPQNINMIDGAVLTEDIDSSEMMEMKSISNMILGDSYEDTEDDYELDPYETEAVDSLFDAIESFGISDDEDELYDKISSIGECSAILAERGSSAIKDIKKHDMIVCTSQESYEIDSIRVATFIDIMIPDDDKQFKLFKKSLHDKFMSVFTVHDNDLKKYNKQKNIRTGEPLLSIVNRYMNGGITNE